MPGTVPLIMVQFLRWVGEKPRTYEDVMGAWRTSCPRLSVWEDATLYGLIAFAEDGRGIRLTAAGRQALAAAEAADRPVLRAAE